jgi:low temperature requirement protein LtrA
VPSLVLRDRDGGAPRVTSMELFFDLVYVFAVTQLSHTLFEHLSGRGAAETLVLFLAVWWAWNYTAWATNWIDPDRLAVRALMVGLMLISLIMSAAIPQAFGDQALAFAAAYVALQVIRSGFMVVALRGQRMGRNYAQLLAWSALAGIPWLAGAAVQGDARLALWVLALLIDLGAPLHGFWLPRAGSTDLRDWTLAGAHLAERMQLVVIIALGESILVSGLLYSELSRSAEVVAAFVVAFLGSVALWWLYFAHGAEEGTRRIARAFDPARMGRAGYAYGHAVMVAGIIVAAVGDERVLDHPSGDVDAATAWVVLGGPALYLAGSALFNWALSGQVPASRAAGVAALALLGAPAAAMSPLALAAAAAAVLVVLVALDARGRTEPVLGELTPRAPTPRDPR